MNSAAQTFQKFAECIELLRKYHDVETSSTDSLDVAFELPKALQLMYQSFPDVSCFCGQDFLRAEPAELGHEYRAQQLEANLIEFAYENQAVWILATEATACLDQPVFVIDDEEVVQHASLNFYLAGFLLSQTVWNAPIQKDTDHSMSSAVWQQHGYQRLLDGWEKPGHLGYASYFASPDGRTIAGFWDEKCGAIVCSAKALPSWA